MKKKCVLDDEKLCNDCGECDYCDLNPFKICDNCGKCIDSSEEYRKLKIDEIDLSYHSAMKHAENNEEHDCHCCDCEEHHHN
ncbi:MAG: hypothetical protein ACI4RS_03040 [Monoglobaceae bacterium]